MEQENEQEQPDELAVMRRIWNMVSRFDARSRIRIINWLDDRVISEGIEESKKAARDAAGSFGRALKEAIENDCARHNITVGAKE